MGVRRRPCQALNANLLLLVATRESCATRNSSGKKNSVNLPQGRQGFENMNFESK